MLNAAGRFTVHPVPDVPQRPDAETAPCSIAWIGDYLREIDDALGLRQPPDAHLKDRDCLPTLVERANQRCGLNARYADTPNQMVDQIKALIGNGVTFARFVTKAAGETVHWAAFDY